MSEPNFKTHLSGVPAVFALIGSRVYPDKLSDTNKTLPAVVTQKSGGTRGRTQCATDGLVFGSFQFDVYAKSRTEARAVADAIRDAMADFSGLMGSTIVKDCALSNDFDSVDPEPGLLRRTQFWDIWYVER